jgi:hypothetical protein
MDALIASVAVEQDELLVTPNIAHFLRVPGSVAKPSFKAGICPSLRQCSTRARMDVWGDCSGVAATPAATGFRSM